MGDFNLPPDAVKQIVALQRQVADLSTQVHLLSRPYSAGVGRSTAQTISTGTLTAITFGVLHWDLGDCWNPVLATRLTAPVPGTYHIGAGARWQAHTPTPAGMRSILLRVNGTTYIDEDTRAATSSGQLALNCGRDWPLAAGAYVELICSQTAGSNQDVLSVDQRSPALWMHRVGS